MMAKEIRRIEIEPAENGGHTVTHHFKESMRKSKDSHSGMAAQYHEPEHHVFGRSQGHEMLAHVANHLQIPESGPTETLPDENEESDGAEGEE